jgi:hypothetical protein
MGKKRKRTKRTSKGIHTSVACTVETAPADKILNKLTAWQQGKNPWVTIEDNQGPADRRFRKVRSNALWGNPKNRYNIYSPKKDKNANRLHQRVMP